MEVGDGLPSIFNFYSWPMARFLRSDNATDYLHPHQIEAVIKVRDQLENPQNPKTALVILPTGCGKTGVAVLATYALSASRVLVVTPSVKISEQIHEAFCGSEKRKCFLRERNIVPAEKENNVLPHGIKITATDQILPHKHFPLMIANAHKFGENSKVAIDDIPDDNYDLVIVDEAHHYPAPTWKNIIDHFPNSMCLFLTATNLYRGRPILQHPPCFCLDRQVAVQRGIIRPMDFDEDKDIGIPLNLDPMTEIAARVVHYLRRHDEEDPNVQHQAMVLTQTRDGVNSAEDFKNEYDAVEHSMTCEMYVDGSSPDILKRFENGEIRILIVIARLIEGYDNKRVSVVGIARNVAPQSKVLFTQFLGRAVRKYDQDDPVTAMVVSHPDFNQKVNFEHFDEVTETGNIDEN